MSSRSAVDRKETYLVAAGVVMQAVGLAVDAVMHRRDPVLDMHETTLTVSNPAHLVLLVGTALAVGAALALLARTREGGVTHGLLLAGPLLSAYGIVMDTINHSAPHMHAGEVLTLLDPDHLTSVTGIAVAAVGVLLARVWHGPAGSRPPAGVMLGGTLIFGLAIGAAGAALVIPAAAVGH